MGQVRRVENGTVSAVRAFRTSDPEMLIEGLSGADLHPCQLSRNPAPSELARVLLSETCLDMVRLGPAMLFTGATPRDCYTFIDVLACPQPGRSFNFELEHTDGFLGFFAPGGSLDAITPAGYQNMSITVPAAVLHADLAASGGAIPDSLLAKGALLRVGEDEQRVLRSLADAFWKMVVDPAQPLAEETTRRHTERSLRSAFLDALISGSDQLSPPRRMRLARRYQLLGKARDYLAAHAHEPVYLDDLCAATGIGRRAMENLFRDLLGLAPTTYLRHLRLHGSRRHLRAAEPSPGGVKTVAYEWGFLHLGRFAAEYFALFDEHPSKTLVSEPQPRRL